MSSANRLGLRPTAPTAAVITADKHTHSKTLTHKHIHTRITVKYELQGLAKHRSQAAQCMCVFKVCMNCIQPEGRMREKLKLMQMHTESLKGHSGHR